MRPVRLAVLALSAVAVVACRDTLAPPSSPVMPRAALQAALQAPEKATICHAAGQAGTTHFNLITISLNAVAAHFDEHGTPQAGHEQDFFATESTDCDAVTPGHLQVCVMQSGTQFDAAKLFDLSTALPTTHSLNLNTCSGAMNAAPGAWKVDEAAPGIAAAFEWFVNAVGATPAGALLSSTPDVNGWTALQGRGNAATAMAQVFAATLTTVTFYNRN